MRVFVQCLDGLDNDASVRMHRRWQPLAHILSFGRTAHRRPRGACVEGRPRSGQRRCGEGSSLPRKASRRSGCAGAFATLSALGCSAVLQCGEACVHCAPTQASASVPHNGRQRNVSGMSCAGWWLLLRMHMVSGALRSSCAVREASPACVPRSGRRWRDRAARCVQRR